MPRLYTLSTQQAIEDQPCWNAKPEVIIESFQGPAMRLPGVRFSIRRMMLTVALAALVFSYVGSYYRLSRRGMREAALYNIAGFLYVSYLEAAGHEDLSRHYALMTWYAPLNWLDRTLLETTRPTICIMWRLSG